MLGSCPVAFDLTNSVKPFIQLDKEFPMIHNKSTNSYKDEKRNLFLFTSIFFFFLVSSLKYFIVKRFDVATFCDIRDWTEFSEKVSKNLIKMLEPINCVEKCNQIHKILLTKVFESNYYFF